MSAQIVLIEDDDAIAAGLERVLVTQGHAVDRHAFGQAGQSAVSDGTDLVVLDLGLPDVDGVRVCRRLRDRHPALGILILSARDQELDIVAGLDAGADDYLIKPFRLSELLARVRAHLRRRGDGEHEPLRAGPLVVDQSARRAFWAEHELQLRPKEFDLLALLVGDVGRVVTRERIMREIWDTEWLGSTKTLDTHILTLRQKLADPRAITTLRGVGYRLEARCGAG